jgi:predicted aldo/keto reductase-like oxidoreductase
MIVLLKDSCFWSVRKMNQDRRKIDRRSLLKTIGAAGVCSVFASTDNKAVAGETNAAGKTQQSEYPQVPRRKLGKTGVEVPCLSLGGNQDLLENQIVLRTAPQWGVDFWDTAHNYRGGNSELGIGKYLSRNPEARKKLFIASKASRARTIEDVESLLQLSLKTMKVDYIDLYDGLHRCSDPSRLTNELKEWAESAKKLKLIRFFGITTHQNMDQVLAAAAKLEWIDVVMTAYNFRLMQDKKLSAAIDACHKAGLGIVAIKTQGFGQNVETEHDKKLAGHFLQRGFTQGQAKVKAVLQDERISSACVGMHTVAVMTLNVAAVLDKTKLTAADMDVFKEYADATCRGYCAGCAHICNSAVPEVPYISDIMRYLMYYDSYGDRDEARGLFAQIPGDVRNSLLHTDYSRAEAGCPQNLPIGKLICEAVSKLA